jgi:hypothetical protein
VNPSQNNHRPRAARGPAKLTVKSREDCSILVKSTAPNSAQWMADPVLQTAGTALIQAGVDLSAGEKLVQALKSQVDSAEKGVVTLKIAWDEHFNVFAGRAELNAVKPEDITNLGLTLLEESSYKLAPAISVAVRYDILTKHIRILVHKPPGNFGCRIEISPNPIAPGSFQALKGLGARRALSGYAPGGYWVQATMIDMEDESETSPPVFVTVT